MNTDETFRTLLEYLDDDWLYDRGLFDIARNDCGGSDDEARTLALRTIERGLREGLIRVGDATTSGFQPWDGSVEELMARIDALWPANNAFLPGDICWFALTTNM